MERLLYRERQMSPQRELLVSKGRREIGLIRAAAALHARWQVPLQPDKMRGCIM